MRSLGTHPTAEEIYAEVTKEYPSISLGTVYRNLKQLAEDGDILHVSVVNAPDRFDRTTDSHRHFLCMKCGRISDYRLPEEPELFAGLNPELDVRGCELLFKGYCATCRENS